MKSKKREEKVKTYDPKKIEKKWQNFWLEKKTFFANEKSKGKKKMVLIEFPYPSGAGLHMGHMRPFIAGDVTSKYFKLNGFNTMYPIGWDAFGLPAENYAIKNKVHPSVSTKKNISNAKKQLQSWGTGFDWGREIDTTDPEYYKWTQKIFLEFFKAGLAYEKFGEINWCPKDKTGLANEEVVDGKCERCGTEVQKKNLRQWYLKITDYAEKLLDGLKKLPEWPEPVKIQQGNWIGKSEGVNIINKVKDLDITYEVYDSIPQTIYAQTFGVIAPEHPLVYKLVKGTDYEKNVMDFVEYIKKSKASKKFDIDNDLEGIFTGRYIENYLNTGIDLPIWVASYVLYEYGTGAVNCSAHDERDFLFAKKYNITLKEVLAPHFVDNSNPPRKDKQTKKRKTVQCIIEDENGKSVVGLKWSGYDWQTFVIGGVEEGETPIDAAKREIIEETGFTDFEYVKTLGGEIHSEYFANHKDENRYAEVTGLVFRLKSRAQITRSNEESNKFDVVWVKKEEMEKFYRGAEVHLLIERYKGVTKPIIKSGILLEPSQFKGREWNEVREDMIDFLVSNKFAKRKVNYKLRDWVFSRQRYWGEPIPLIHCPRCGIVPVPEKELPVKLPNVKNYEPTGTGESPLASIDKWVNTKCPSCRGKAKRETNTMPQWAGSSWYYLRYMDPKNKKSFADLKKQKYWSPVDLYFGGMEHTTLHLLYSRFWNLMLKDKKLVAVSEPYKKRVPHGIILGPDGEKMSKSRGNVINPDDIVAIYGADTVRLYMMFLGPHGSQVSWNDKGIVGARRFIERVFSLQNIISKKEPIEVTTSLHKTIKKVGEDIENFSFNTAVSAMMIFVNTVLEHKSITEKSLLSFVKILAPFCPHVCEELWQNLKQKGSVFTSNWPKFDAKLLVSNTVPIVVQANGKFVTQINLTTGLNDEEVIKSVKENEKVAKLIDKKIIKKVIVVKDKIVNFVF